MIKLIYNRNFIILLIGIIILYICYHNIKTKNNYINNVSDYLYNNKIKKQKKYIKTCTPNINKYIKKLKKSFKKNFKRDIKLYCENFNNLNSDNKVNTIKLYYADWCPHCINFKEKWYYLKNKYNNKISFQEINCTNNEPKVDYVVSFPTIALYNNNNFIDIYKDDRNKIEEYIKKIL